MMQQETVDAMRASDLFAHVMGRTLSHRLIGELSNRTVSLAQVHALRYMWLHDDVLMGDLAEGLGISYPSATNMVKRLERRGFVMRRMNPVDRREVEVRLTDAGVHMVTRMETERVERLGVTLRAMASDDREALLRGLVAFVRAAVAGGTAIASDLCLRCGREKWAGCPVCQVEKVHADE